jgi:two-component system chemotaxis response regulator CheY
VAELDISKVRFLIAEDNTFMQAILRQLLGAFGVHDFTEVKDGAEAWNIMADNQPDIILLDWEMAPANGIELAKRVRKATDSPNRFIPMIMITGHSEKLRITEARDAGINEILIKPISATQLYQRIKSVIDRPRQFVESKDYFGPDRRRRRDPSYSGPERRADAGPEGEADLIIE